MRLQPSVLALCLFALAGCPETHPGADGGAGDAGAEPVLDERGELLAALDRGEERTVVVVEEEEPDAHAHLTGRATVHDARQWLAGLVPEDDWMLRARYLPIVVLRIRDRSTLEAIESAPGVRSVEPDRALTASAIPSLEMIGQPAAIARGADGTGHNVAVLDTGADFTHADLGACGAAGPDCGVIYAADFAPSDGVRDDSVRHGTNVSAIVRAVAPGARILALDVFSGSTAWSSHIIAALDWVVANRTTYAIGAVNLSLGGGSFTAPCPTDSMAVALQRVRDAGIVPLVASGNDGFTDRIASPACAPAAVSVGAVASNGTPASFSNSASFLTLMAPGTGIALGGVTMSGTSQATPHVAGAVAALRSAYPSDGVDALVARLVGTGVATPDARNGLTFPRISLDAATAGGATAPPPDVAPPTGTFAFASSWARTTAAAYTISASDPSGVTSMCMTTGTSCTTFVPFAASGTFTLPSGDGLKTVRVWLRDGRGNTTGTPLTATVTLDGRAPTAGTLTATRGIAQVSLAIAGATDTGGAIASYRVVFSTGSAAPSNCSTGTLLTESAGPSWTHSGLTNGTTYRYRVCAVDLAGNVSAGATASAMPAAELSPPTGTVRIENDAPWARSTRVTVQLTASDASTVTHVCLSSTTTCTNWVTFAASLTGNLAAGTGARPLYAFFRDQWGNASTTPATDTILLDTTLPPNPTVSVEQRDGQLVLSWPEGSDTPSGLSGYVVAHAAGTTAPACSSGAAALPASAGTRRHTIVGLTNGTSYAYRVCAVDVAGNVSAGTIGTAIPAPELTPPVPGSIVVAAGAAWTRTSLVGVSLSATDPAGVASMCLSASTTCTTWAPYATSTTFSLGTTAGTRTVRAWFRDAYGNATVTPISDSIGYDATAPTNPTVSAVARSGAVEISFGPSTDTASGVAGYLLAWGTGTSAPPCAGGTAFNPTELRSRRIETTSTLRWRVCALDVAGNASAGATGSTTPLP